MKKKFLKILIVMIMLVITCATIVNALSFTATMEVANTIAEATEFTAVIKVSNLDVGQNGINILSGYIKYDKDVFETISESSIEGINGWSVQYASDSGKVTLTKATFVKTEEAVFNVTFKTKTGVAGKEGLLQFTNIVGSNSDTDISATDVSAKIMVGTTGGNIGNVTGGNSTNTLVPLVANRTNNTTVNTTNTNTSNNSGQSFVNTTNMTDEDIPYTGVEDSIPFLIAGIVILAIVFYVKIEKLNKDMK